MKIQKMFAKEITRDLQGVIVVGEGENSGIKQELEEYVVTRELQKHFREFFSNYKKGIVGRTTKTGVWISGFFGSGKSHFLKILSYLLENKIVDGKPALQYLIDNGQIKDSVLLEDMKLAVDTPTDVVLFNIDSKAEQSSKQTKDAIVMVFLKVFNEMQGFYGSMPYVADLERQLFDDGRYEEFQKAFEEEFGKPWKSSRNRFDFIQDTIVDVLDEMGYMSEAAARNWCEKATEPYQISIENFAKMVREYIDRKSQNQHIAFLVDEVGQYIGENSQLMLNLQTIREELGKECKGRAWVIVTSQQDIDSITNVKGNDFSKIQGRFDTRLSLSSANVDEVIKERILRKTPTAAQTLRLLYGQKETQLSNIITFANTAEMKLYSDEEDFVGVYPFVPYQFHLLAGVLTSIRTHGASGKHLSEGERSMLALFKESAEALKDQDEGALVPFYLFYDGLESFLDAAHSRVIRQALDNKRINPDGALDCFAVHVLKCLFLIKYVKEFEYATLENITSLMISHVDEDRAELSQRVDDALRILIRETLVQKHSSIYVFLTEEEQEIGRDIDRENVEMSEIIGKLSETIFDEIFTDKKYKYPKWGGRYTFSFNQTVDDRPYKANQTYDIGVHILTPYADTVMDETTLRMVSGQGKEVLMVLPEDKSYINETRQALKIEKYLRKNTSTAVERYEDIKNKKRIEMRDCFANAKLFLTEAMKEAVIYVNGDRAQLSAKDVTARINEALGRLVDTAYHKLYYIDTAFSADDIRKMFTKSGQMRPETAAEANAQAQNDVLNFIAGNSAMHMKTSMKTLKDKFTKAPYGFVEDDVEWLAARLFKKGDILLSINGLPVTLMNKSEDEMVRLLTKKEFAEKLLAEHRIKRSANEIRNVRQLIKEVFGITAITDDEDDLMRTFQRYANNLVRDLDSMLKYEYKVNSGAAEKQREPERVGRQPAADSPGRKTLYPGRKIVESGLTLLRAVTQLAVPSEFYPRLLKDRDDLLDFAEDYEPVKAFFGGEQKKIFDDALRLMKIYEESKSYIVDEGVETSAALIQAILQNQKPYKDISKLPALLDTYRDAYMKVLDETEAPVLASIKEELARVMEVLDTKPYKQQYSGKFHEQFADLITKAEHCNNITILRSYSDQANAVRMRLLNQMDKLDAELARKAAEETKGRAEGAEKSNMIRETLAPYGSKKKKNLPIKTVTQTSSWRIESKADIDNYVEALRRRLEQELEEETIINIEF